MKIYKSKVSGWVFIPVVSILTIVAIIAAYNKIWVELIFLLLILAFVTYTLFSTHYTIDNEKLIIKCGFLYSSSIDIKKIKKIIETNNPISSPASSLDRLDISYNKWDRVLISPKNKLDFIQNLKQINGAIEVKLKS